MTVQVFTGFPLLDQIEDCFAFDIAKNVIAQTPILLSRRLNHGEKRLHHLRSFFHECLHCNPYDNHGSPPLRESPIKGLGDGIFPNSELSPSCLPSKKIKGFIIIYPNFVPDWVNATLFDPRY